MSFEIRHLGVADVQDFRSIRLEALQANPEAFGSVHEVEVIRPIDAFNERLETSMVFGSYCESRIVGVVGLTRQTGPRNRHKGFVWGMYVRPEARRNGMAAGLMAALIACAAGIVEQLTLTVVEGNDAALALYEKFGFQVYGVEPRALKNGTSYADEILMSLILR